MTRNCDELVELLRKALLMDDLKLKGHEEEEQAEFWNMPAGKNKVMLPLVDIAVLGVKATVTVAALEKMRSALAIVIENRAAWLPDE